MFIASAPGVLFISPVVNWNTSSLKLYIITVESNVFNFNQKEQLWTNFQVIESKTNSHPRLQFCGKNNWLFPSYLPFCWFVEQHTLDLLIKHALFLLLIFEFPLIDHVSKQNNRVPPCRFFGPDNLLFLCLSFIFQFANFLTRLHLTGFVKTRSPFWPFYWCSQILRLYFCC